MLKTFKTYIVRLLLAVMLVVGQPAHANADFVDWIENTFEDLFKFLFSSCMEVPNFNSFATGNVVMDLEQSGKWVNVGNSLVGGKMLKLQWSTQWVKTQTRQYIIMYRIDPRFTRPQLFILKYNYSTKKYESDFHRFNNGILAQYQANGEKDFATRATKYGNYFYFQNGRDAININEGDVINITLVKMSDFLALSSQGSEFRSELNPSESNIASVFTQTGIKDNGILYSDSNSWCNYVAQNPEDFINVRCMTDPDTGSELFAGRQNSYNRFVGIMDSVTRANILTLPSCPENANGSSTNPPCIYDRGRGMKIIAANKEIKSTFTPFIHSKFIDQDFFYYKSNDKGVLDFVTSIPINNMFQNFPQDMSLWHSNPDYGASAANVQSYLLSDPGYVAGMSKFLHLGRYIMMVNVGSGDPVSGITQQENITLEYQVLPPGSPAPPDGSPGIDVSRQEYTANASQNGNLWLKVSAANSEKGAVTISYAYYRGSTFLSDILYNSVALPVMNMMRDTSALFYSGIATNPQWQLTVRILLSLYIIIYGLSFLAGKIQVTVIDVMTRLIKISVVFAMFSGSSWQFFNNYVFNIFLGGMSYLASNVMGATSSVGNLFGFVDVIFDKYTNPIVWKILCVELLQIQNGMTYLSLLMIEAIFSYLSAVVEVVICYIMAFITMCILISLAPIFLVCMLFERTRGIFDNWMSLLFNYMIQPTVLLIFFLLIDRLMTNQFSEAVMQACWNWLITINIDLDLSPIGVDLRVRFDLPFLPGIPFYTAALLMMQVSSPFVSAGGELTTIAGAVLMFKIYAQLSNGLIGYVTNVVAGITNVSPARKSGVAQSTGNVSKDIGNELKAPFAAVGNKAGSLAKDVGAKMKQAWKNPQRSGGGGDSSSEDSSNSDPIKRDSISGDSGKDGPIMGDGNMGDSSKDSASGKKTIIPSNDTGNK
jgi:type IV secretion system protein VirB6